MSQSSLMEAEGPCKNNHSRNGSHFCSMALTVSGTAGLHPDALADALNNLVSEKQYYYPHFAGEETQAMEVKFFVHAHTASPGGLCSPSPCCRLQPTGRKGATSPEPLSSWAQLPLTPHPLGSAVCGQLRVRYPRSATTLRGRDCPCFRGTNSGRGDLKQPAQSCVIG